MILYHGSNTEIEDIQLEKCRPFKDFGKGFYATDLLEQAERMAQRTARLFGGTPCVSCFEFSLEKAILQGLSIKVFERPDEEWAKFLMANRDVKVPQPAHEYDIVVGPVANDTIARLIRLYSEEMITPEQLLKELTFAKTTSQYFFHTDKAIKMLWKIKE